MVQEIQFDKARAKTLEAEEAARIAHANAEKALQLLRASEQSSLEVAQYREQATLQGEKLGKMADTVSPPLKQGTDMLSLWQLLKDYTRTLECYSDEAI